MMPNIRRRQKGMPENRAISRMLPPTDTPSRNSSFRERAHPSKFMFHTNSDMTRMWIK